MINEVMHVIQIIVWLLRISKPRIQYLYGDTLLAERFQLMSNSTNQRSSRI